jgi:hypothetical protein
MKYLTLLFGILLFSLSNVLAKCYREADFYIGASHYHRSTDFNPSFAIDTLIDTSEPISISVKYNYEEYGKDCWDYPLSYEWKKNGVIVSTSQVYTIVDTGSYMARITMQSGHIQYATLHVGSLQMISVNEISSADKFSFYPSLSSGIFQIKSEQSLTKIQILDTRGRLVFNESENLSSIDLSGFSAGVYFYYVEDKSGQVYRGRIIKD